ncbi:MAG: deoxyribonuclease IV [Phycisphaeraceae bacterium]|nr:MAG: deoxyribonuclease IV [Phycisphaeraceae bacterium]
MFGSHLSIAGDLSNALREAESLGLDTVQIFTKNQRQWAVKPLDKGAADAWVAEQARLGWLGRTVAHDSYLINLASPDNDLWEKSIALMREEIERCERLRIGRLVSHPGAHTGSGVEAGLLRIARAYKRLLRETRGCSVMICLEDTAGGGSTLGRTFEELATLRELIFQEAGSDAEDRIGFCLDTCHAFAAGYDIATEAGARAMLDEFDRVCGLERLAVVHLNDSKGALGSRIDRHEHIGEGGVGLDGFRGVVNHPAVAAVPKIMETPKGKTPKGTPLDTLNLRRLRRLMRDGGPASGSARRRTGASRGAATR